MAKTDIYKRERGTTILCIVCGFPVPEEYGDRLTCTDRCLVELKNRQEIAKLHRRKTNQLKHENYRTMTDTAHLVLENFARVLLERDIPYYTSNVDIDREICKQDKWFNELNQGYRRRCITQHTDSVGYIVYATGNRGKKTFKLAENRDALRERLVDIVSRGGMTK